MVFWSTDNEGGNGLGLRRNVRTGLGLRKKWFGPEKKWLTPSIFFIDFNLL